MYRDYRVMRRKPKLYRNGELVVVIDCSDLARSAVLVGRAGFTAGRVTGGPYRSLVPESGEGIEVLLQQVREGKCRKNRLHLDLRTADLDTEVLQYVSWREPSRPSWRRRERRPADTRYTRLQDAPLADLGACMPSIRVYLVGMR
jgi:hypothetical protein